MSTHLASQCSIHSSCNSNDLCQRTAIENPGYTSSLSTDTLWDPKSEPATSCNRQVFKQRPSSVYHPSTSTTHSYITHRYVHPSQVQPVQNSIATTHAYIPPQYNHNSKPKSWDNLAKNNASGNYAIGAINNSGYNMKYQVPANSKGQPQQIQQSHIIIPRKSNHAPYGRYSAFAEVENYVPAPTAFLQEETITKTTIITTKSTENLISNAQYNLSDESCECLVVTTQPQQQLQQLPPQRSQKPILSSNCAVCNATNFNTDQSYQGYYSNLTRNAPNRYIPTKTEITRL